MNTFFTELAKVMADAQELQINITKTGDTLTALVMPQKGKGHQTMSGSFAEMDENFFPALKMPIAKTFTSTTSSDETTEDASDDGKKIIVEKKLSMAERNKIKKNVLTLIKDGDALLKKKKNAEALAKYEEAKPLNKEISFSAIKDVKIDEKIAKAKEGIVPDEKPVIQLDLEIQAKAEEVVTEMIIDETGKEALTKTDDADFNRWMKDGGDFYSKCEWKNAMSAFASALELKPEDETAKSSYAKAQTMLNAASVEL